MLAAFLSNFSRRSHDTRIGPYTVGHKLGEGGVGVVYAAEHPLLRRRAALKVLRAERAGAAAVARFEREAEVTARLCHPNIVSVYDSGRASDGTCYYAMEYLDGMDLERLVDEHGPLSAARVADILGQAAEALAEAHAAGVIHRDIKPANLVLCDLPRRRDTLKVVDFGLVRDLRDRDAESRASELMGTPLYMAPETVAAPEEVDGRADVYALGAVGYFLLTGMPPFSGQSVVEVCAQHLHARVTPPSEHADVPADLERLILACLAKSPAARPTAAELADALGACRWSRAA